jgi:hypothetical protein
LSTSGPTTASASAASALPTADRKSSTAMERRSVALRAWSIDGASMRPAAMPAATTAWT